MGKVNQAQAQFFGGGKPAECRRCGKLFLYYTKTKPRFCPTCMDVVQQRPSVVQQRESLALWEGIQIVSLPDKWQEFVAQEGDAPCYRMTVKGSRYGASWNGRIDIFAESPFEKGDIVDIREMRVVHRVKAVYTEKRTIYGGTVTLRREVPLQSKEGKEELAERRYLYFTKSQLGEPKAFLVWAECCTKTTLKGFGRQYWCRAEDRALKSWSIFGGYRSGRAYTHAYLAIVDPEHPLILTGTGDIQYIRVYDGRGERGYVEG